MDVKVHLLTRKVVNGGRNVQYDSKCRNQARRQCSDLIQTLSFTSRIDPIVNLITCLSTLLNLNPLSLHPSNSFPLNLVHKIKIGLLKMMNPHISIFPPTSITLPLRMNSNGIQRTKMSSYPPNFILENLMVKASFKFTLARLCRGDIAGFLATSQDNLC